MSSIVGFFKSIPPSAYVRAGVFVLSVLAHYGIVPLGEVGYWSGIVGMGGALLVPAGQKNPTPEEIKAIVNGK